jgi:hypothetical protein
MKAFFNSRWFPSVVMAIILALGGTVGGLYLADAPMAQGATNFDSLVLSSDLTVGGNATIAGTTVNTVSSITPANGSTLTVSSAFYQVNSSGNVTITLGTTGAVSGQIVYLYGDDANTVLIADTNVRTSSGGALSLGQYDIAGFIFNGTDWIELFLLANS